MSTVTTFRVEFTTFVFNGQYMVHGKGSTKWYRSEAEIPAVYMASVGLKYDDENGWLWYQSGAWRGERMDAAEALIESKLLRGLPDGCGVDCFDNGEGHRFFCVQDPDGHYGMESDTPLEALAEYFAPGSTQ